MQTYIVQARFTRNGRLVKIGEFNARTHTSAIIHAAKILRSGDEDAVELIATLKEA
jgi:hypothetical protein